MRIKAWSYFCRWGQNPPQLQVVPVHILGDAFPLFYCFSFTLLHLSSVFQNYVEISWLLLAYVLKHFDTILVVSCQNGEELQGFSVHSESAILWSQCLKFLVFPSLSLLLEIQSPVLLMKETNTTHLKWQGMRVRCSRVLSYSAIY